MRIQGENLITTYNNIAQPPEENIKVGKTTGGRGMETVRRLRAMASLCRQSAALHPDIGWKLLAEAEYWEHLANAVLLEHFSECTASSNELMQLQPTANANDTRCNSVAAA
jgi:hypothetical protein